MASDASTTAQILRTAEFLVRSRGYNAFSYADIAKVVGISTASIHYHFPSKADLVRGITARYIDGVDGRLAAIRRDVSGVHERLAAFVALFRESLGEDEMDRMCACMMLATEAGSLPSDVRAMVSDFIHATGAWVADVMTEGRDAGEIDFAGDAALEGGTLCATIEGATFVARGCNDISMFDRIAARALSALRPHAAR